MNVKGKSICFTGKLYNFTRNQARAMAVKAGMIIAEAVTHGLDYLVMADPNSTSSKACKARGYGIHIISESQFLDMMKLDEQQVKAETDYKKTHKEKPVLDWKTCFDIIAKKLGLTFRKKTEPIYWRGKDEKKIDIDMYIGNDFFVGSSNDILKYSKYEGKELNWTDDDKYDLTVDEAYKKAIWVIGTKAFKQVDQWSWNWSKDRAEAIASLKKSYPEFGMPGSTEELKLKLEILDWSII